MIRVRVSPLRLFTDPGCITQAQIARVGAEFLPRCEPYIPKKSGALIRSGSFTMEGQTGKIQWTVPYARLQSYLNHRRDGKRGSKWVMRAWAAVRRDVIRQVNRR